MAQEYGWTIDPYGLHEQRYFSGGRPTKLVRDNGLESYDEPPGAAATEVRPGTLMGAQPTQVSTWTRVESAPVTLERECGNGGTAPCPPRPRHRRSVVAVSSAIALATIGAVVGVFVVGSGSQPYACALMTKSQAQGLLGFQDLNVSSVARSLVPRAPYFSSCSYSPSASYLSRDPQAFESSFASILVNIETVPKGFPNKAYIGGFVTAVPVDGLHTWWIPIFPTSAANPNQIPGADHVLAAIKDGYLVTIQADTENGAESLAQKH